MIDRIDHVSCHLGSLLGAISYASSRIFGCSNWGDSIVQVGEFDLLASL